MCPTIDPDHPTRRISQGPPPIRITHDRRRRRVYLEVPEPWSALTPREAERLAALLRKHARLARLGPG